MNNTSGQNSRIIRPLVASIIFAASLLTILWYGSEQLLGKRPTASAPSSMPKPKLVADPMLDQLREQVKQNQDSVEALSNLAKALETKLREQDDQNLLLEQIQTLSNILKQEPKNSWGLLQLADLSFDRQIFDKAETYYQRYLQEESSDFEARSRYASSLIFTGKPDLAITELNQVLAVKPEYFQALAFKSIALSEKGDIKQALEIAEQALKFAPNEEARQRFSAFLNSITGTKEQATISTQTEVPTQSLEDFFKNHPIIGPKLIELKNSATTLEVILKDFPVQAMPEFVKTKLIEKIKAFSGTTSFKKVLIYDQTNPEQALQIDLN